jgi:DNA polymerase III delta prime subunit
MQDINQFAWIDKYAPKTVDDLIATDSMKTTVNKIVANGKIPDLLLEGPPGIGKTAIAKLLCNVMGLDSLIINASLKGNIDTLRNEIAQFAGSVSLSGEGKCVVLDEADYLNAQSTQPALRNFIDTYRGNCSFILTANYGNRIIGPLRERLEPHSFKINKGDVPKLIMQMTKRCEEILQLEGVEYDKLSLAKYIAQRAPNWRSILINLQRYARDNGKIDMGLLGLRADANVGEVIPYLKSKDFTAVRMWVAQNADTSAQELFTDIVEALVPEIVPQSLPALYMTIARYQYQSAFVADQQINFAAAFAEIMTECLFV